MGSAVKRIVVAGALVVVSVYAVTALRGPQGMSALFEKRREIELLHEQNATIAREIQMKKERIERLKHSSSEQELEIRRQLKLLRPGETLFMLPETPKTEQAPAPAAQP